MPTKCDANTNTSNNSNSIFRLLLVIDMCTV